MKRFSSSDSFDALITVYKSADKTSTKRKQIYGREFQAMMDCLEEEEDCREEASQATEKKRRLTVDQVKALEKNFEVDNKLEPDRKVKLAEELGLQPRQISVWFQNRRARLKSKELERDYGLLKANYDALRLDYNNLQQENEALTAELRELKAKLCQENEETSHAVEAEAPVSEQSKNHVSSENANAQLLTSPPSFSSLFTGSSSSSYPSMNWVQFSDSRTILSNVYQQPQLVKVEEQSLLFNPEDPCNIFSVDQAPTLQWYFTGH